MSFDIGDMLEEAIGTGTVTCPDCGEPMEPDASKCGHCKKSNPLRDLGFI